MKKNPAIFDKIMEYMQEKESKFEDIVLKEMVKDLKIERSKLYEYLNDLKQDGIITQDKLKTGRRGRPKTLYRIVD